VATPPPSSKERADRPATVRLLIAGALAGLVSSRLARAVQADRVGDGLYDDDEKAVYGTTPDVLISMVTARATARRSTSGPTPLTAGGPVARTDSDGNGLFDDETAIYGTNPQVFATDGDGVGDGEEIYLGTNPASSRNIPQGYQYLGTRSEGIEQYQWPQIQKMATKPTASLYRNRADERPSSLSHRRPIVTNRPQPPRKRAPFGPRRDSLEYSRSPPEDRACYRRERSDAVRYWWETAHGVAIRRGDHHARYRYRVCR
jgi:hypothetical protein